MEEYNLTAANYWNYLHNLAFMVDNLAQGGRRRDALFYGKMNYFDIKEANICGLASILQEPVQQIEETLILPFHPLYSREAGRYYMQGLMALPLVHYTYASWAEAFEVLLIIRQDLEGRFGNTVEWVRPTCVAIFSKLLYRLRLSTSTLHTNHSRML